MQRVLNIARIKWASLLLSLLFCIPIAFIAALAWLNWWGKSYSLGTLAWITPSIVVLLLWGIWYLIDNFLEWLKSKQINISRRDYVLLFLALIPVIAAVYFGWTYYSPKGVPNLVLSNFEVEIGSLSRGNEPGNICILEIKSRDGLKIQPENDRSSEFSLSQGWKLKSRGCQYFSQGGKQQSLRFHHIGSPDDALQILFRENKDSGKAFVRLDRGPMVEVDLHSEEEGNSLISIPLQLSLGKVFLWDSLRTAGWFAVIIILVMILTLVLRNAYLHPRISALAGALENRPWISLVALMSIAVLMFWPPRFFMSSDAVYYLSLAKNLYYGNGYVNPDLSPNVYRGPVFPLLISFSYGIFGESLRSALLMERIFWFLTILISYFLGRRLYNHRVGLLTAFFVLTAGVINESFKCVWADGPLTFATLALQLLFWQACINPKRSHWYALMGLVTGTTYLLKQTVIFITPLPLLIWVIFSEYRTWQTLKKLLIFYFVFALFYLGWDGYVFLAGGTPGQITGTIKTGINFLSYISRGLSSISAAQNSGFSAESTMSSLTKAFFNLLDQFYTRDILRFFRIALVFPIALSFILYQATVKKKSAVFLILGLSLYTPLILVQAVVNFSFRQNLYFYCIGLLCIAAMVDQMFSKLSSMELSNTLVPVIAVSLILIQLSGGNYIFSRQLPVKNIETINYLENFQEIASWVNRYIKPDMKIMIASRDSNYLHILTDGNRQFETIDTCMGEIGVAPAIKCKPPYVSFWVYHGVSNPENPRDFLQGISETSLISAIREKHVKYVFVTPAIYSLYFYLKAHPDFEEITILDNIAVFRVLYPVQAIMDYPNKKWETCVGKGTSQYLKNLKEIEPARYEMRLQREIEPWMGLSNQDLQAFINWPGCQFEVDFPGSYRMP